MSRALREANVNWRFHLVWLLVSLLPLALLWQFARLQILPDEDKGYRFLQRQGDVRSQRLSKIRAYRGVITDRHGELLAVSTPLHSLFIDPQRFDINNLNTLAEQLKMSSEALQKKFSRYQNKKFMYLARHLPPQQAEQVMAMNIPGVSSIEEFRRYYPAGEVAAHLVGFTDIDDSGQEGMELALNEWLAGAPGKRHIIKDLKGNVVKDLGVQQAAQPGKDVQLSMDLRIQYIAHRELKSAIEAQGAKSGSVVVLDVATGDVLAMANQPSYNPNDRSALQAYQLRNRAIVDQFEPGSTMKPFTVMAALESKRFNERSTINTDPGYVRVGSKTLLDARNYGVMALPDIIAKSSQVGISKLALELDPQQVHDMFYRMGFGQSTGVGFPGENVGLLPNRGRWQPIERATFAFGHGLTVTALQLAKAYAVIANNGQYRPVSLIKRDDAPESIQVVDPKLAQSILNMLETVTQPGGTGLMAQSSSYSVAGKTGTTHKVGGEGYSEDRYVALFAGMAPSKNPRIVTVVIVNEPSNGRYFGGESAAPVFANVVEQSLRALNVAPDRDLKQGQLSGHWPKALPMRSKDHLQHIAIGRDSPHVSPG